MNSHGGIKKAMRLSGPPFLLHVEAKHTLSPRYIRCTNPACNKLNPVNHMAKPGEEHVCVFCGQLFKIPEPTEASHEVKKPVRGKKPVQKAAKPENRNMRKPMI